MKTRGSLLLVVCAVTLALPAQGGGLKVTDWASHTGPLFPHSAIIEGKTEVGVVDTQQSKSEALRLIAEVLEKGKTVKWVYVTHPHLDHFAGSNLFRQVFPGAKFYAPAGGNEEMAYQVKTRRLPLGKGTPGGEFNLPETAPDYFEAPPAGNALLLDGERVEILLGKGDHPSSSVVWVPSAETVIAGDVIFNKIHAFFGDHSDLQGWIELVSRIQKLNPKTVVAAHSATLNPGGEIVTAQLRWLKDLKDAMAEEDTWKHTREVMMKKYPGYGNDFIFEFSYGVRKPLQKQP